MVFRVRCTTNCACSALGDYHHTQLLLLLLLLLLLCSSTLLYYFYYYHCSYCSYYYYSYCTFLQMQSYAAMVLTVIETYLWVFAGSLISLLGELLCHQAKLIECSSHSLVPLPCLPFPTNHTLLSLLVSCQLCLFECCWLMGWSVFPPWECCFWLCFWSAPVFPVLSSTYDTHGCAVKKYCSTLEATVNQDHYWFTHYIFTMTLHCNVLCRLHRTAPGLMVYWCSCPVDTLLYLYCAWCLYPNVWQYYANCGTLLYHWMTWCIVYRQAGAFLVVTLHLLLRMLVLPCLLPFALAHFFPLLCFSY